MRRPLMTLGALLTAGIMSLGAAGGAIAQQEELAGAGVGDVPHPAHIHTGTCGEGLGEVVTPLNDVASNKGTMMGTPTAGGMASPVASPVAGSMMAIPVMISVTTVDVAMADILAGEHAINVHESAENIGNYIACGNVNALPWDDQSVLFGIAPLNDSGYSGIGSLYDNGDGTTTVYIYLTHGIFFQGEMLPPDATPVASPVS